MDAQANAYEICAYLVLARFTEETGRYSSAGISAVSRYTGANKAGDGPLDRAIKRLKTIRAKRVIAKCAGPWSEGFDDTKKVTDLGPILFGHDTWQAQTGEIFPDPPHDRAKVLFVLPDFDEPIENRVWFGGGLVSGTGSFDQPLRLLTRLSRAP